MGYRASLSLGPSHAAAPAGPQRAGALGGLGGAAGAGGAGLRFAADEEHFLSTYAAYFARPSGAAGTLRLPGNTLAASKVAPRVEPLGRLSWAPGVPGSSGSSGSRGPGGAAQGAGGAPTGPGGLLAIRLPQLARSDSEPVIRSSAALATKSSALASTLRSGARAPPPSLFGTTSTSRLRTTGGKPSKEARRTLLETLVSPEVEKRAREIFDRHDGNHNGRIELVELLGLLETLQTEIGLPMPASSVVERMLKEYDVDHSGSLDFREFFDLFVAAMRDSAFDRSSDMGREFFVTRHQGNVWAVYDKVKELGVGSFGTAFMARHKATQEDRVVKAVKKSRAKMPIEDIEKEILVMRQVDHPHIVRLFEWYEDLATVYLVMEALTGGTLREVIIEFQSQHRSLKEEWIRSVVRQSVEAMVYCHSLRLIHKDLKDENIMLIQKDPGYAEPFVVIIDLGIAEMFSAADPHGQECGGTPVTMAPEVWRRNFGPKCDVWSLGCILYEMLSGTMPFMAKSMAPTVWLRLHKRGPDWGIIKTSPLGKDLCKAMLTFSEAERPSMAQCLEHKWFEAEKRTLGAVAPSQFLPLKAFHRETVLKRSLLLEIASRLPMHEARRIVDMFEALDVDGSGTLTLAELKVAFAQMGIRDEDLVARAFRAMDVNGDGLLSFSEFAAGTLMFFKDILEDRFHSLFEEHDLDHDGKLDANEMAAFLSSITLMLSKGEHVDAGASELLESFATGCRSSITYPELRDKLLGSSPASSPKSDTN